MRIAYLVVGIVLLAVLASANIPRNPTPEPTVPQTACESYTATSDMDRAQQWIATLQSGLIKNPELSQEVWLCVMDVMKIDETDRFVFTACKADPRAPFEPVVFKALEHHLDQCGIGIER
jgi:hypothetical protein